MTEEQKTQGHRLPDLNPIEMRKQLALLRMGKLPWTIKKPIGR